MAKRKKQSDFLFFVISVALLYGFYYLFIEPQTKITDKYVGKQSLELQAQMIETTAKLKKSASSVNTFVIERAEDKWLNNPFYDMVSYGELALAEAHVKTGYGIQKDSITYSGFVDVGDKKIAIINDMEYEVGETLVLTSGMYKVESILPNKILIGNKASRERSEIRLQKMEE